MLIWIVAFLAPSHLKFNKERFQNCYKSYTKNSNFKQTGQGLQSSCLIQNKIENFKEIFKNITSNGKQNISFGIDLLGCD